jgi:hypothetical protein
MLVDAPLTPRDRLDNLRLTRSFLEHGRAPDRGVVAWQDRLIPLWRQITGGCHLNRKMDELIAAAGFHITELKTFYLPGPRPMTYTYQDCAQLS